MSSWLSQALSSHKAQLAATAVVSGVLVGSAILGLQAAKKSYKIYDLKESIPDINEKHHATKV